MKRKNIQWLCSIALAGTLAACGGSEGSENNTDSSKPAEIYTPKAKPNPNGIGPVKELELGAIDPALAAEGEAIFTQNCTACHKMEKRHVGPGLAEVLERRNPVWVMNMILNPEEMVKEDPVAKQLLAEYLSPMANQNLTEAQARAVVEYFRQFDRENQQ